MVGAGPAVRNTEGSAKVAPMDTAGLVVRGRLGGGGESDQMLGNPLLVSWPSQSDRPQQRFQNGG